MKNVAGKWNGVTSKHNVDSCVGGVKIMLCVRHMQQNAAVQSTSAQLSSILVSKMRGWCIRHSLFQSFSES
jgi:hypothetical protein